MKTTITNEALEEVKSVAEREEIKNPAVYLDLEQSCCGFMPKVEVVEQTLEKSEMLDNANGIPFFACDLVKRFFKENEERNNLQLRVDLLIPYGLSFQILEILNSDLPQKGCV